MISKICFKIALKSVITTLIKPIYHTIGLPIIPNDTVDEILPAAHQTSLYLKLHDLKFWERKLVTYAHPNFSETIQDNTRLIEKNCKAILATFGLLWYTCVQDVVKMLRISNWSNRNVWSNKETHPLGA